MEMRERIKAIRTYKGMTQAEFAIALGLAPTSTSSWERNINPQFPTETMRILICEKFSVNRNWLETGEGEMMLPTHNQTLDRVAQRYSQSQTFRAMLDVYAEMDEAGQAAVERYVELLTEAVAQGKDPAAVMPSHENIVQNAMDADGKAADSEKSAANQ